MELQYGRYGSIPDTLRESKDRQCFDVFARPGTKGMTFCALGTLAHKAGENPLKIMFALSSKKTISNHYNISAEQRKTNMKCPECGARCKTMRLIAHLNDNHRMKWGDIADNLERAEPYDMSQPKINQILDDLKDVIGSDNKILQLVDRRFRS